MHMLDRVIVRGFKSIREMDLRLTPLNILIGANGSGKSNFISLFQLINRIIERKLQLYVKQSGGAETFLYFGRKITGELYFKLHFEKNSYQVSLLPTRDNRLIFNQEKIRYWHPVSGTVVEGVTANAGDDESRDRFGRSAEKHIGEEQIRNIMNGWKVNHFHDTSDSARVKDFGDIHDNAMLRPDASNLAAFLYMLREKHSEHYQNIVETIRLAAPFFDDFSLRPNPLNERQIQLEWQEKGSDAYFNAHSLSDGTLRFICLATLLLQPQLPTTILLDEPELGLHPYAIRLLADMLQSAAETTQVIVSTQSVTLVNQFNPDDIIVVDREEKQSVFKRLSKKDMDNWLEEYGLGDLWEKNIIGGRPTNE
jgi:predicted ATPase